MSSSGACWLVISIPYDLLMGEISLAGKQQFSATDWEQATAAVLRKIRMLSPDAPDHEVWDALASKTLDGLKISALGTADLQYSPTGDPGSAPFARGTRTETTGWDIRARHLVADNKQILADLVGGATSIWLFVSNPAEIETALADVLLDIAPVALEPVGDPLEIAKAFVEFSTGNQVHPATNFGANQDSDQVLEIAQLALVNSVLGFSIDGTLVNDQGASDVQELAYALLAGVKLLRQLEAGGIEPGVAAKLIEFKFSASDEQLPTIAKFRAARRLWNRVGELCGVPDFAQRQHAVTSRAMLTKYDPYVNMLRTTVAAFSAGVAGADAVTVIEFDDPLGLPEPFSRRIARNTSHLLLNESHVGKVVDPAGGSHVIEKLTDDMATAAWELFGQLDAEENRDELLAGLIEKTSSQRQQLIAHREMPITGVSEFPNLAEVLPERKSQPAYVRQPNRYAAAFEAMRDEPPNLPIFLATLGSLAQHTARATFVNNLFAAGGIAVVTAGATSDVAELLKAYEAANKPKVVCVASSDAVYEQWGADAISALRSAGAEHVIVAGKNDLPADDRAVAKMDALDFLAKTRAKVQS